MINCIFFIIYIFIILIILVIFISFNCRNDNIIKKRGGVLDIQNLKKLEELSTESANLTDMLINKLSIMPYIVNNDTNNFNDSNNSNNSNDSNDTFPTIEIPESEKIKNFILNNKVTKFVTTKGKKYLYADFLDLFARGNLPQGIIYTTTKNIYEYKY